ncbi:hypothetical protein SDC9_157340 [bioreactor metagenome]|uniref:Uncharacterized protein n=1 Tax=bioreactor metagenome TaxID=1076179 RepID=A0A645F764_9ZZZZ
MLLELILNILGSEVQGDAIAFSGIGGQHTYTTTIGDDEQVLTLHRGLQGKSLGAVEKVVQVSSLDDTRLAESRAIDLGSTGQGASVRGCGSSAVSRNTRFEGDDRFLGFLGGFNKGTAFFETFDVQGDAGGVLVVIQPFNQVGKINIAHIADGDQFVKTNLAGISGGIESDEQGATLGDEG